MILNGQNVKLLLGRFAGIMFTTAFFAFAVVGSCDAS